MTLSARPRLVKLVRDNVGKFLASTEGSCEVYYAPIPDRHTGIEHLRRKLIEEAAEYLLDPCLGELADVMDVVVALAKHDLGSDLHGVMREAQAKTAERGAFDGLVGMYCRTTAPSRHERG